MKELEEETHPFKAISHGYRIPAHFEIADAYLIEPGLIPYYNFVSVNRQNFVFLRLGLGLGLVLLRLTVFPT